MTNNGHSMIGVMIKGLILDDFSIDRVDYTV